MKGTNTGTATGFDGDYELNNVGNDAILVFSYIGYQTQEIAVDDRSTVDITMTGDAALLEEVVVVGYGTQRRKDVTGSISSLKSENFNKGVVTNPG